MARIVPLTLPHTVTSCATTLPSMRAPSPIMSSEARSSPSMRPNTWAGPLHSILPVIAMPLPMHETVPLCAAGSARAAGCGNGALRSGAGRDGGAVVAAGAVATTGAVVTAGVALASLVRGSGAFDSRSLLLSLSVPRLSARGTMLHRIDPLLDAYRSGFVCNMTLPHRLPARYLRSAFSTTVRRFIFSHTRLPRLPHVESVTL